MDFLYAFLRITHVLAAFVWFGLAFSQVFFVMPAAQRMGDAGRRYLRGFYQHTRFALVMNVSSLLVTAAGLLMYALAMGPIGGFTNLGNMSLAMGATAGILAFGHGVAALGRLTGQYETSAALATANGASPDAEQEQELVYLENKLKRNGWISFGLMTVALVTMSVARYLPEM